MDLKTIDHVFGKCSTCIKPLHIYTENALCVLKKKTCAEKKKKGKEKTKKP